MLMKTYAHAMPPSTSAVIKRIGVCRRGSRTRTWIGDRPGCADTPAPRSRVIEVLGLRATEICINTFACLYASLVGREIDVAADLLRALSSPVRLGIIVELCATQERCVHELVDTLGVPQPLVSQHLRVLRGARLITGRRDGREIRYSLVDEHVAHIVNDAITHAKEHP